MAKIVNFSLDCYPTCPKNLKIRKAFHNIRHFYPIKVIRPTNAVATELHARSGGNGWWRRAVGDTNNKRVLYLRMNRQSTLSFRGIMARICKKEPGQLAHADFFTLVNERTLDAVELAELLDGSSVAACNFAEGVATTYRNRLAALAALRFARTRSAGRTR